MAVLNPPRLSHGHLILGLGFCAACHRIVTASWDGNVCVWDAASGNEMTRFREGEIDSFAMGDGVWAVGLSNGKIRIRDSSSGCEIRLFQAYPGKVSALAFSPDNRFLVSGAGNMAGIWNLETGNLLRQLTGHRKDLEAVTVSRTGRLVATVAENIRLWDAATGKELMAVSIKEWSHLCVAISPCERMLAGGGDGLELWDIETRKCILRDSARTDAVTFTPDGKHLLTGGFVGLRKWVLATGEQFTLAEDCVRRIAVSHDGAVCLFAPASDAAILDLRTMARRRRGFSISAAVFCGNQTIFSCSGDGIIRSWDTAGNQIGVLRGTKGTRIITRHQDSLALICDDAESLTTVWDMSQQKNLCAIEGTEGVFSPVEPAIAVSRKNCLFLYRIPSGKWSRSWKGGERSFACLGFSPDGRLIAAGSFDDQIRIWNLSQSRLWSVARNIPLKILYGHQGTPLGVEFSADGRWLASTAEDNTIRLWPLAGAESEAAVLGLDTWATSLLFARPAILVVGTLQGEIRVYDIDSRQLVRQVQAHQWRIHQLSMSADSRFLVSSSHDGSAIVWDLDKLLLAGAEAHDSQKDFARQFGEEEEST